MQFGSGVPGAEPPVDGGLCRIALGLIGVDGSLQGQSRRDYASGDRPRVNTLNSISAMFSQLACLGVW